MHSDNSECSSHSSQSEVSVRTKRNKKEHKSDCLNNDDLAERRVIAKAAIARKVHQMSCGKCSRFTHSAVIKLNFS